MRCRKPNPPKRFFSAWHRCDVADLRQVSDAMRACRPQVVYHLAAIVSGSRGMDLVIPTLMTNLVGTVNVLLTAAELNCSRVVCLGSLQEPDEESRVAPSSPYAAAKFSATAYARMFTEVFSLSVGIGRPFMAYGPGQMDLTKLVPYVTSQLLRGGVAELSSGRQSFDWVYVDDVVDALLAIGSRTDVSGTTIDIGCGVLTTVREVAEGIGQRLGAAGAIRLGTLADRRLEPTRCADVEATARLINWRARVSLEEGLDRTVEWYRKHLPISA